MEKRVRIWAIAALASIFSIASSALNIIFAIQVGDGPTLSSLRTLLYIAFVVNLTGLIALAVLCAFLVRRLASQTLGARQQTWCLLAGGAGIGVVGIAIPGVALIWVATRQNELPSQMLQVAPTTLTGIWFGAWAVALALQISIYWFLYLWAKSVLTSQRASRLDMDFRARAPSVSTIARPTTQRTDRSFGSQEITLHSSPQTPRSRSESFTQRSSSIKVGQPPLKLKLARFSNHSTVEVGRVAAGDTATADSAFDSWDTSSVHDEMRAAIHSSPPVMRVVLETIPGSRPESTELDEPFLPESPISSSPPHVASSDAATVCGGSSSPRQQTSSPPSSPINFSRPTSRPSSRRGSRRGSRPTSYKTKIASKVEAFDFSMQELIHPLFRPNSPHPPPLAIAGTMVTASPMADGLITPKTLAKLRSDSHSALPHWKAMPTVDRSETQSVDQSVPDSPTLGSPTLGSPGPSVVDETELPPILPGFVLSAGSRTSLMGYGKRKKPKAEKTKSTGSLGSRLSQVLS